MRRPLLPALLLLTLPLSPAWAENRGYDAHRIRFNGNGLGLVSLESPDVNDPFVYTGSFFLDLARRPTERPKPRARRELLENQSTLSYIGAGGFPGGFELTLFLPYHLDQTGDDPRDPGENLDEAGFGDSVWELKKRLWVSEERGMALGAAAHLGVPTGSVSGFRGHDRLWTWGGSLLAEARGEALRALLNLTCEVVEQDIEVFGLTIDDRLRGAFASEALLWRGLPPNERTGDDDERIYSLFAHLGVDAEAQLDKLDEATAAVEVFAGLRLETHQGLTLTASVSRGLTRGYRDPEWRFIFGLQYSIGGPSRRFGDNPKGFPEPGPISLKGWGINWSYDEE